MRAILQHCDGGRTIRIAAGTTLLNEGETTGRLYVLLSGRLDVLKGETVVATLSEPGGTVGEMSTLLGQPHSATVIAMDDSEIYVFDDAAELLEARPAIALPIARLLAARLRAATTYLADLKTQYAGYGNHLEMVGAVLESLVTLQVTEVSPGPDRRGDPRL